MSFLKNFSFKKIKWPTKNQWKHFFNVLNKKEKSIFFGFLFLFIFSSIYLSANFYLTKTEIAPAFGGTYSEGIVGSPRFINPIYAPASDTDRDLVELIFSGLMKFDSSSNIVPDLAESYKILDNGKIYEFTLKKDIIWQDNRPLTSDDVIFTIKTLQDSEIKSPLRGNWLGVTVERVSDYIVRFRIDRPSSVFLQNSTVKIIPKHIWENIPVQNLPLTEYNLNPIGSGPYLVKEIKKNKQGQIKSIILERSNKYFGKKPYIPEITFYFFNSEEDLIAQSKKGAIKGLALNSFEIPSTSLNLYSFNMPRYFATFFNLDNSDIIKDENIRKALSYGTNKEEIVKEVLNNHGNIVNSPILPTTYGLNNPLVNYEYNLEKAKELLDNTDFNFFENNIRIKKTNQSSSFVFKSNLKVGSNNNEVLKLQECLAKDNDIYPNGTISGYYGPKTSEAVTKFQEKYKEDVLNPYNLTSGTGSVGKSTREKLNEICFPIESEIEELKVTLTTVDQPLLKKTAEILKKQWEGNLGIKVELRILNVLELEREIIKPRNYEILLFGEILGAIPDPFPFWHSTLVKDPGLNLSSYINEKADTFLEKARQTLDPIERQENLEKFQDILLGDIPAVFLFNPDYLYLVSKEIKGLSNNLIIDPSKRFSEIENWYIKTKRLWK